MEREEDGIVVTLPRWDSRPGSGQYWQHHNHQYPLSTHQFTFPAPLRLAPAKELVQNQVDPFGLQMLPSEQGNKYSFIPQDSSYLQDAVCVPVVWLVVDRG